MAFSWVPYYKELAQKLAQYRDRREELLKIIRGLDRDYIDFLEKDNDGTKITDIHPFAVYSIFNRLTIVEKKQKILEYFKNAFKLTSEVPTDFDGIPSVNPQNSFWGMPWDNDAKQKVEENWDLFCCAVNVNFDEDEFCKCFDKVISQQGAKWNVTQALFRMNPDKFISLDGNSRDYLSTENITVFNERDLSGKKYLSLLNDVKENVNNHSIKEKNFYELSHNAWKYGNEKINYWIIAPGTNAAKWDEYSKSGEIGIGWDELGPLSNYKKIEQVRDKYIEIWHPDNKDFASNAPNQIWNFYKNIQIGDVIIARKGVKQIIGLGKVTSDYFYDDKRDEFFHLRKVNWEKIGEWQYPGQSTRDTVHILKPAIVKEILKNMNADENAKTIELTELLEANKNLILHGAPGTGKTYLAKEIAKEMGCSDNEIGFVQFHPSYDYTDFVEGLRPVEGLNGVIGFERKDGVFKDFCAKALKNFLDSQKTIETVKAELSNKERIDSFLSKCIADGESFKTAKENTFYVSSFNEKHVIISYKNKEETISDKVKIKYSDLLALIKEDRKIERTEVKILTGRSVERQEDTYSTILINELLEEPQEIMEQPEQSNKEKNYVFIIDEINRGELSKIFGELFFSIDPGYRGIDDNGKPKGLVKTQYQNLVDEDDIFAEGFYIPENVYIIGTMNDIDRSVESMDFAMRRRFIFEEVTAEDSAENMNLSSEAKERMKRINDVIANTEGLNDAYKIGGAYFLNVDDFDKLWKIKLSSLVKEYLRGIDDDGSKYQKIEDAYFNRQVNDYSDNDE